MTSSRMASRVKGPSFIRQFLKTAFLAFVLSVVESVFAFMVASYVSGGIPAGYAPTHYWFTWFGMAMLGLSLLILLIWTIYRTVYSQERRMFDYICLAAAYIGGITAVWSSLFLSQDQKFNASFFIFVVVPVVLAGTTLSFVSTSRFFPED